MASSTDRARWKATLAVAVVLAASLGRADDRPVGPPAPPQPPVTRGETVTASRWYLQVGYSSVFDTNIDHTADARQDYGVVLMGGAGWQSRASRPGFAVHYEAARHQYRASPRWDRFSQRADAAFEKRLGKRWTTETRAEMSLKGSSEDRELGDQYTLLQQADFRIVRGLGLRLYGLARLKRYEEADKDRDATNTYAGTALRLRVGRGRFEVGSRYEKNDARVERHDFDRWVHRAGLAAALGRRDDIELEVRLYDQQYPFRKIRVGADRVVRQDQRLISAVSWSHRFPGVVGIELDYKYERRNSNDPEKAFRSHLLALAFQYRFDRARPARPE